MEVSGKVVIPEGVEVIKDSVFSRNDKITEVVLPACLHTIEANAFQYCYALQKINLENVNKIGSSTFNATAITEAEVCAGYINCFGDCSKLKNLTLKNISGKFMAAHYRLKYPIGLSGEARKMYSSYIDEHAEDIVSLLIKKKDFDIEKIRDFPYLGRIKAEGLDRLIAVSEELERTELAEWLKSYRGNKADYSADSFGGQETVEENKLASEENEERLKNILWKKVFDKYQRDAEKGNCSAQYELATLHEKGKGVTRDEKLAAEWMTKSADQGYVYAQVKLGMYYEDGVGVEKSYEKAFEQFEKAAEQGNEIAQFKAGVRYSLDRGVQGDIKKAAELFKKSAEQGLIIAQFNIALCYECGEGVEQDYEKAFEWYTKAAEQNNWDAYDRLGRLYENGNGIEKDINKAVEMYTMAAESGSADGMENLARCYGEGLGVEKDAEKAKEWREKAGIIDR